MRKKKPTRKTKKKPTRASKPPRSRSSKAGKKRTRKRQAARKSQTAGVAVVEVLEVATIGGEVSDADEAEVPAEEITEDGFPPEFGGEE